MNDSGYSVAYTVGKHEIDTSKDLIIIHDDKDIELGKIKIQVDRSDGGHNGVKSIIQHLKTKNFIRIRVGVANDKTAKSDTAIFVLKKFGIFEKKKLQQSIEEAVQQIYLLIKN